MSQLPIALHPAWQALEEDRLGLLSRLASLPPTQLRLAPAGSWCMLEVVEHLSKVDYLILKSITKSTPRKQTLRDAFLFIPLMLATRLPIRFRAPKATAPSATDRSLAELVEMWSKTRHDWYEYLKKAPLNASESIVFTHPRAAGITLPQTLRWLAAHQRRHLRQIARLQQHLKKTSS